MHKDFEAVNKAEYHNNADMYTSTGCEGTALKENIYQTMNSSLHL